MSRTRLSIAGVVLVGSFALFVVARTTRGIRPEPAPEVTAPVIDAEARQSVVTFWQHYRSGMRARRDGNWELAVDEFSTALAVQPGHEDSLYYMGNALFELGEYEGAVASWKLLLEANPMASRAHVQLGQLHSCPDVQEMFDLEEARSQLESAIAMNPEESGPLGRLAEVELALGNRERAGELFAHVRQMNPRANSAHYLGAYLAWHDERFEVARQLLTTARSSLDVSRVTDTPVLEGDIRPEDEGKQIGQSLSSRRLFASLLLKLTERDPVDIQTEVSLIDAYLYELQTPDS